MKGDRFIIRIGVDGKIEKMAFPTGNVRQKNDKLCDMIASDCDIYEMVHPARLYSVFDSYRSPYADQKFPYGTSKTLVMLVDKEGLMKEPPSKLNKMASWLYKTDIHGQPIVGSALIIGLMRDKEGNTDLCPILPEYCDQLLKEFTCFSETVFGKESQA